MENNRIPTSCHSTRQPPPSADIDIDIVVWIEDTFDNKVGIENDFEKYLKESCW